LISARKARLAYMQKLKDEENKSEQLQRQQKKKPAAAASDSVLYHQRFCFLVFIVVAYDYS
jgi:hypothetical protein